MNFRIERIGADELASSLDVIRRSFATVAERLGLTRENCPNHTSFMEPEKLAAHFAAGWRMFGLFAQEEDGAKTQCGFCAVSDEGEGVFELRNLAVLPPYRGQGLGGMLVEHALRETRALGGSALRLGFVAEDEGLRRFYERCGFVLSGTQKFPHLPFTVGFMQQSL